MCGPLQLARAAPANACSSHPAAGVQGEQQREEEEEEDEEDAEEDEEDEELSPSFAPQIRAKGGAVMAGGDARNANAGTSLVSLTNMLDGDSDSLLSEGAMESSSMLSEEEIMAFQHKYAAAARDGDDRRTALRQKLQQDWEAKCMNKASA